MVSLRIKAITLAALSLLGTSVLAQNAPRLGAYGTVMQGNLAADFTTADYLARPHLIGDNQYIAGYTGDAGFFDGTFAIKGSGFTWFGEGALNPAPRSAYTIKAGLAQSGVWGAGFLYQLDKVSTKNQVAIDTFDTKEVFAGDAFGLFGSFNMGGLSLSGQADFTTAPISYLKQDHSSQPDFEYNNSVWHIMLALIKDTQGEKSHAWGVAIDYTRSTAESDSIGVAAVAGHNTNIDTVSNQTVLYGYHGIPLVYKEGFGVFFGSNSALYMVAQDFGANKYSAYGLKIAPNMAMQKDLGKGFELSMGASAVVIDFNSDNTDGSPDLKTTSISTMRFGQSNLLTTGLDLGLRWKKDNLSIEGNLSKALVQNGPNFIGGTTPGVFGAVGVSVGF